MKCDGYRILIQEMLKGRLDIDEAAVVSEHMDICESCRSFHRNLVDTGQADGQSNTSTSIEPEKSKASLGSVLPVVFAVIFVMLVLGLSIWGVRRTGWGHAGRNSNNSRSPFAHDRCR